ncbi:MAG: ATPase, T2SS/T4P/T4SS family, partial [Candidatus Aenigmatarchaeota archaeon]
RKSSPWTLPEFIKYNMITPEAAGLLSFLLDGNCSILVVGPRGSGKTSLLTSLMLEINQNNRIIVIEDTPEVPVDNLRELGYKIEHLKTEAFAKGYELSAEDALRTSLRLGESILIIGEVRGPEAKALFEAMRIGAVGNIVMGTIHGSGPYDVWDRITNDLGVPSTSFKATDIIITTGIIRKGDDIRRYRRVLGITEVRKNWRDEPIFYDLMKYDRNKDKLILCDLKKSETIKKIATMKGFSINQAIKNIQLRSYIKKRIFEMHKKHPQILNAKNIINANNLFLKLSTENKDIKKEFEKYFKQYLVEQYG